MLVLAAAACTALILGAAPPAGAAPTAGSAQISVPAPPGGVNVKGLYSGVSLGVADHEIAAARQLHARVVRAELRWSTLEPLAASQIDPHAVAFTDRLVADAAAAGIRVIFTVDSTPCWASSAPAALLRKCLPGGLTRAANAWPPRNPADYAAAVAFIARRYGTQLAAIEVWNEPDQANQLYFAGPK